MTNSTVNTILYNASSAVFEDKGNGNGKKTRK